jgi:hypothetical protein
MAFKFPHHPSDDSSKLFSFTQSGRDRLKTKMIDVVPRARNLLWQVSHNILPIKTFPQRKKGHRRRHVCSL